MNKLLKIDYSVVWEKFVKMGNDDSLSQIYYDHYDLLFNYGLKYTSDLQIVEDSIQNIFGYFLKIRKSLSLVNNVTGYLFMSFRRQLFLDLKERSKSFEFHKKITDKKFTCFINPEQELSDLEDENQLRSIIKECIAKLSTKQQEIIYLKYDCDLSYADIAVMLEITVESCHKQVYRAIKSIRIEAEKMSPERKRLILFSILKVFPLSIPKN